MGGNGSGRLSGDGKTTTDSQHQIDIRRLKKQGFLQPGNSGSLSWSCNGEQTGLISFRMETGRMILDYKFRYHSWQDWEPVEQIVLLDKTSCNFGGYREWLLCPRCRKRVAILYGAGKYFFCRHCYGLCYESQQENETYRLIRKAQKIRERLGASENLFLPILFKPKGMHQKTFDRLRWKADNANLLSLGITARRFGIDI